MLMVIFGAGASYDSDPFRPPSSVDEGEFRPPLASELFDANRRGYATHMGHFPECLGIIPILYGSSDSVEVVLEKFRSEEDKDPERPKQLAAIRFYLQAMLSKSVGRWIKGMRDISNYVTLLDELRNWQMEQEQQEQICLVTFNYDTLLETALLKVGIEIKELSDYIKNARYQLIKLHGSVNWAHQVSNLNPKNIHTGELVSSRKLINDVVHLKISGGYRMISTRQIESRSVVQNQEVLFPAVAIPVETKEHYECPETHLEVMRESIPKVTKLLLVGWRAAEAHFLEELVKLLTHNVLVMTVAGSSDSARDTNSRLQDAGVKGIFLAADGGFTKFVADREAYRFLRS